MLKIHHFRNATMVIETEDDVILIDPMLGLKGSMPTFTYFRFKAQKNPIVPIPKECQEILKKVTHCLITHKHPDHIDKAGEKYLRDKHIPITCSEKDESYFKKKGLNVVQALRYWEESPFLNGTIEGIPARHGYQFIAKPMGNVMGFFIKLSNQKSIYLSSDTIFTSSVDKVLREYKPDISVVACGTAQLDIFKPLLMIMPDILKFIETSPHIVIANHMEAVNHCPSTRKQLQKELNNRNISKEVLIPEDGDILTID